MSRPASAYWRKIVRRYDKPYDRAFDGSVLSVSMDILECGHEMKSSVVVRKNRTTEPGQVRRAGQVDPEVVQRICKKCEKEQS